MATTGYYLNQYVTKTLNGSIDNSQTTSITLNNSTGLDTSEPGIAALTWSDPLNTSNIEWITYTSISANVFQGVTRGAEGSSGKAHSNGAVIAFPISESHVNNLVKAVEITGAATNILEGVLDEDDMASDSATKGATQQSIKAYVDNNSGYAESAIEVVLDNAGSALNTGVALDLEIPFDCTINGVTMLADQSGSVVIDIWKDTYANYPPTDADSITASAVPTITTATKSQDNTLTGWTTSLSEGDTLRFNVDSVTTITRVTLSLDVTKS
jgi:hypothetical protein